MDFKKLIFKRNINQYPDKELSLAQESIERTDSYLESYSGNIYYIYKVYDKVLKYHYYVVRIYEDYIIHGNSVKDIVKQLSDYGYTVVNPYRLRFSPLSLSETDYK